MGLKYIRNYNLTVQGVDESIISIPNSLTIEFDIQKNNFGSQANAASIKIYNLSKQHRSNIRYDLTNVGVLRNVTLSAGYGSDLATIFTGNISQAFSVRRGTEFITEIQAFDGGYALTNAFTNRTIPSAGNPTLHSVVTNVIQDLQPQVQLGVVSSSLQETPWNKGTALFGPTKNILDQLCANGFYIDNGKAYVLQDNDFVEGQVSTISAQTGLLDTPLLELTFVEVDTLFEPKLFMGQSINLISQTVSASFNQTYKIIGIKHRGMISQTVCGEATTHVTLQALGNFGVIQQ